MTVEQTPEQRAEALRRKVSDLEEKANKLTGEILFADELTAVSRRHGRLEPPVKGQTRISCQYCGRTFQVREAEG